MRCVSLVICVPVRVRRIVDEYEPIEEGLDPVTEARNLPTMVIKLSKEALDKDDPGYQEPERCCLQVPQCIGAPVGVHV